MGLKHGAQVQVPKTGYTTKKAVSKFNTHSNNILISHKLLKFVIYIEYKLNNFIINMFMVSCHIFTVYAVEEMFIHM